MTSFRSIPGGGHVNGATASKRTIWRLSAGRRGKVGIILESSAAYRMPSLFLCPRQRALRRFWGFCALAIGADLWDTSAAQGRDRDPWTLILTYS